MEYPSLTITPIGIIRSSHLEAQGTPIQPLFAKDCAGTVELDEAYADALQGLEKFDRIWLIYWFNRAKKVKLKVTPYLDSTERGLFATRAPSRPNGIGISCVRLVSVDGTRLNVDELDILDGTPLLDIKPYVPKFDSYPDARYGWLEQKDMKKSGGQADNRFE